MIELSDKKLAENYDLESLKKAPFWPDTSAQELCLSNKNQYRSQPHRKHYNNTGIRFLNNGRRNLKNEQAINLNT